MKEKNAFHGCIVIFLVVLTGVLPIASSVAESEQTTMWNVDLSRYGNQVEDIVLVNDSYVVLTDLLNIIKLNAYGELVWTQKIRSFYPHCEGYALEATNDSGYIGIGFTERDPSKEGDMIIVKLDDTGDVIWNKTRGDARHQIGYCLVQTSDAGFLLAGETKSMDNTSKDVWVMKINEQGTEQWNRSFPGVCKEQGKAVRATTDGGFVILADSAFQDPPENGSCPIWWLLKIDGNGTEQWNATYAEDRWDEAYDVQQTTDGGFVLTGRIDKTFETDERGMEISGGECLHVMKTDAQGHELWRKTYNSYSSEGHAVQQTTDGGLIITGWAKNNRKDLINRMWLIKTDTNGREEWQKSYGHDVFYGCGNCVFQTQDGGYIIGGTTNIPQMKELGFDQEVDGCSLDAWVIKTDEQGNTATFDLSKDAQQNTPGFETLFFVLSLSIALMLFIKRK